MVARYGAHAGGIWGARQNEAGDFAVAVAVFALVEEAVEVDVFAVVGDLGPFGIADEARFLGRGVGAIGLAIVHFFAHDKGEGEGDFVPGGKGTKGSDAH